jgi:uncharacterized protein
MSTLYAILALDAPGTEAARAAHRQGHLDHFAAYAAQIAVAGPMTDNGASVGSLVIFLADSAEAARAFIEGDPFFAAGIWSDIRINGFTAGSGFWPQKT